jgi:hypothetical protein
MALITTIAELKKYIAIEDNAKYKTFEPFIKEAEQLFIKDLLGKDFYNEFTDDYEASVETTPVPLNEAQQALLEYIQRPLSYYTLLQATPHLSVTVGEMGIRQIRDDKSDAAPRWKEEKLSLQSVKTADLHADLLLKYLEDNAAVDNDFATWFTSSANTKNSGNIIYSTAIASRHISINDSRRVFLQLRNKIREIEKRSIPKLIGQEQYDQLVSELIAGTVTGVNRDLLDKIEPIICKRALYMQLPFMRVQINENGVLLYSGTDEIIKVVQLATDADVKILRTQLMDQEEFGYLADENELNQFIIDNIEDYPLIAASPAYTVQPDPGPTWTPKNDCTNNFFAV